MSNSKNTIIGFVLIFAILIGYYFLTAPSKEELLEQRRKQDSLMMAQRQRDSVAQLVQAERMVAEEQKKILDTLSAAGIEGEGENISLLRDQFGSFALAAKGEEKKYFIENDLMKIGLSTLGGKISFIELKNFKTWDGLPLVLMDSDTSQFGFSFFANNRTINTNGFYFQPEWVEGYQKGNDTVTVSGDQEARFAMRLYTSSDSVFNRDQYIEYLFTLQGNNYMLGFDVSFHNLNTTIDGARGYVDFEWSTDLRKQEKHIDQFNGSTIYYKLNEDKVEYLSETKEDEESLRDQIKWLSFKQQFFSASLIADNYFVDPIMRVSTSETPSSDRYLRSLYYKVGVPYTGAVDETAGMSLYFGPNKYNILRKYKLDLERQIPLGWSFFLMQ
ncbi:MAG: membrane protein insertase YidC, partial [Bacteroidales bacterium]|nr:membrane protein insertase YidC [Bacteroidales bacterium]